MSSCVRAVNSAHFQRSSLPALLYARVSDCTEVSSVGESVGVAIINEMHVPRWIGTSMTVRVFLIVGHIFINSVCNFCTGYSFAFSSSRIFAMFFLASCHRCAAAICGVMTCSSSGGERHHHGIGCCQKRSATAMRAVYMLAVRTQACIVIVGITHHAHFACIRKQKKQRWKKSQFHYHISTRRYYQCIRHRSFFLTSPCSAAPSAFDAGCTDATMVRVGFSGEKPGVKNDFFAVVTVTQQAKNTRPGWQWQR